MFQRNCTKNVIEALKDTPVVLISGARQVGKSTLVKSIIDKQNIPYLTMDDPTVLSAASSDPESFINSFSGQVAIDEVQRVPEIFLSIKKMVDHKREPGKFLLTGSANVLMIPRVSDSLAGRMEIINMWPLSQGEIEGVKETFIDKCFKNGFKDMYHSDLEDLASRIIHGGYPEVQARKTEQRRVAWFASLLTSLLQRDIRDLAEIEGLRELPKLLELLSTRAGSLINLSDISRIGGIAWTTLKRYMSLLESIYLIILIQPWFSNYEKRIVKSPKLYFTDTGMLCYLYGINQAKLLYNHSYSGLVIENFVFQEVLKQISWSSEIIKIYTFRNLRGLEVDIILEKQDGSIVGIEVKSHSSATAQDFTGLKILEQTVKNKFQAGYVLYTGSQRVSFGEKLTALPISALWH